MFRPDIPLPPPESYQIPLSNSNPPPEAPATSSKKNTYILALADAELTVSGDFDSGNLNFAQINSSEELQLWFGKDRQTKISVKCWFYFSLVSTKSVTVKLNLQRVNTLSVAAKVFDIYRPCIKKRGSSWQRHHCPVEIEKGIDGQTSLRFSLELEAEVPVFISQGIPWSFNDNLEYMTQLDARLASRKDIYYNRETLIHSVEKRPIHLIALSSANAGIGQPQEFAASLFPHHQTQPHYKRVSKPLVLVTSRVHPGEIGSSYSLVGMIEYLIGDTRNARQVMDQFYFLIVPMLNPDGVYHGNNRMDTLGQNLNRFYHVPDLEKQPSCFAIKSLVEQYKRQIYAFFDLHGHMNKKSCFLFGNSMTNSRLQAESVLFAKYLCSVCEWVEFKSCNFSKKQMSAKDRNDTLSKEGCARVVVHRWTNTPYAFTLETGLFKNVKIDDKGVERYGQRFYDMEIYAQVGAKMLISLFAILSKSKHVEQLRKEAIMYVSTLQKAPAEKIKKSKDSSTKNLIGELKPDEQQQPLKSSSLVHTNSVSDKQAIPINNKKIEAALKAGKRTLMEQEDDD